MMEKAFESVVTTWEEHLSAEEAKSFRRTFYYSAASAVLVMGLIVAAALYYRYG
jgi:hypothetical protein